MKFKSITAFCLFGLFLCSCNREELPEGVGNQDLVLHAGLVSVQSKTWLDSEGSGENLTRKVYWSDGDRINVNGQNSLPISVPEGMKVGEADFHLRSVDGPYNVIYPHDIVMDETYDEEGKITINLSSTQTYHPTTFASGSAVMYAYSETEDVSLKNLCAAVRVNLIGKAAVSSAILVSESSDAPLCGTYSLCPKTGELTPVEGTSTITLEFDELTLSPEGTDFYFTIPAGDYSAGLSLFFTNASDGRKMQCVWKPQESIVAGRLYSFNDVDYSPAAKDIESALEWEEFVLALGGEGDLGKYLYKDGSVRLGCDIEGDLSSINGEFPYLFDGNGKTITRANATQALFGNVSGEVRNLTLAGNLALGDEGAALADVLAVGGKISGCTNEMKVTFEAADHAYVGGLVKLMQGGIIEDCVNSGAVTAKIDLSAADKNAAVGGLIAQINAAEQDVTIKNSKNIAAVTLVPVSAGKGMKVCGLGGVLGWLRAVGSMTLDNCDNEGAVTLSAESINSVTGTAAYSISVGGVIGIGAPQNTDGYLSTPSEDNGFDISLSNCDNSGIVYNCGVVNVGETTTLKKQINKRVFTGGFAGSLLGKSADYASLSSCTNTGAVYTYDLVGEGASTQPCYSSVCGGLVGFGGYLNMSRCIINCALGNGKRAVMSYGGVLGCAVKPFNMSDSDVFVTGYYQRIGNYQGNRAVVAAVPVLFGTTPTNTMNIIPDITGTQISNCRIGASVKSTTKALTTPDGESTEDLTETYSGDKKATLFNNANKVYKEDGSVNNLVCGQGYSTVAADVTVTGFTYWDGK